MRNQDDEFNLRLRLAGGRIVLDPTIRVFYTPRGSLRAVFRQYYEYGRWKPAVMRKHGRPTSARSLVPATFVGSLLVLAPLAAVSRRATRGPRRRNGPLRKRSTRVRSVGRPPPRRAVEDASARRGNVPDLPRRAWTGHARRARSGAWRGDDGTATRRVSFATSPLRRRATRERSEPDARRRRRRPVEAQALPREHRAP